MRQLSKTHRITVLTLVQPDEGEDAEKLSETVDQIITIPFTPPDHERTLNRRIRTWSQLIFDPKPRYARVFPLDSLLEKSIALLETQNPDVIHLEFLFTAPLSQSFEDQPWVLSQHNVESIVASRWAKSQDGTVNQFAYSLEAKKLSTWEQHWVSKSSACIVVSGDDLEQLRMIAPEADTYLVPNGVDVEHFRMNAEMEGSRTGLLFFGTLNYQPNQVALFYFCEEIFPHIRKMHPELTLTILGSKATENILSLAKIPGVEIKGFVEDVRPYLWRSAICVVPLKSGGGTRLKILEALAAECPVVSSAIGVEGLDLIEGVDYLGAQKPEDFIEQIHYLLENPEAGESIASNGRSKVSELYDWSVVTQKLEEVYQHVALRKAN